MLAITSKSPYAVRALCELALCGASVPIPIGELARRRDIPQQFLEGLFATLRRAGHPAEPARRQGRLPVRALAVRRHGARGGRAARGRAVGARRRRGRDLAAGGRRRCATCWPGRRSRTWPSARPRPAASRCTTSGAMGYVEADASGAHPQVTLFRGTWCPVLWESRALGFSGLKVSGRMSDSALMAGVSYEAEGAMTTDLMGHVDGFEAVSLQEVEDRAALQIARRSQVHRRLRDARAAVLGARGRFPGARDRRRAAPAVRLGLLRHPRADGVQGASPGPAEALQVPDASVREVGVLLRSQAQGQARRDRQEQAAPFGRRARLADEPGEPRF